MSGSSLTDLSEFSMTEGKYLWAFFEHYNYDKVMKRSSASDFAYSAGDKVYPDALEYVVLGVPRDMPEISVELPEGLGIEFAAEEYKAKIRRDYGEFMRERYGDLWLNALESENWAVILGEIVNDNYSLNYLTDTVRIVEAFAKRGTAVLDPITYRLFSAEEWHERFFLPVQDRTFDPLAHTVIIVDKHNGRKRARTLGMRKFGRPDLDLINVHDAYYMTDSMIEFANRIMTRHVYGVFTDGKGEIELDRSLCDFKSTLDENMNDEFFHNMHITVDYSKCYHVDNPWLGVL